MSERKAFVQRWFEQIWNRGDADAIDRMFAPGGAAHGLPEGAHPRGPAEFRAFHQLVRGAFPDIHFEVLEMVEEGDVVASRWEARGTHRGLFFGATATGREVRFQGMSFGRIRDGVMREGWNNFDLYSLLRQIDAVPPPSV